MIRSRVGRWRRCGATQQRSVCKLGTVARNRFDFRRFPFYKAFLPACLPSCLCCPRGHFPWTIPGTVPWTVSAATVGVPPSAGSGFLLSVPGSDVLQGFQLATTGLRGYVIGDQPAVRLGDEQLGVHECLRGVGRPVRHQGEVFSFYVTVRAVAHAPQQAVDVRVDGDRRCRRVVLTTCDRARGRPRPREGRRPAGGLHLSRPAPLPGIAIDRLRGRHQDCPGAAAARQRIDHARHLRTPVAGC